MLVPAELCSVFAECEQEILRHKWIESERAQRDLGELAVRQWVKDHWWGYLRARWVEHIQGVRYWVELDRGDFGVLQRRFEGQSLLLDRILDRLKTGWENLNVIRWAQEWNLPMKQVIDILEVLDINSRRLAHGFDA